LIRNFQKKRKKIFFLEIWKKQNTYSRTLVLSVATLHQGAHWPLQLFTNFAKWTEDADRAHYWHESHSWLLWTCYTLSTVPGIGCFWLKIGLPTRHTISYGICS